MAENINININAKDNASTTIGKVKTNLAGLSAAAATTQKSVAGLATGFAQLKGVIAGLAIGSIVTSAFRLADGMVDLSNATNLSTQSILGFSQAVALNGGDMQSAQQALTKFTQTLGDAKNGVTSAQKTFADLGVSINDLKTQSEQDILRQTIQGLGGIDESASRAAKSVDIFGRKFANVDIASVNSQLDEFIRRAGTSALAVEQAGEVQGRLNDSFAVFQIELLKALGPLSEFLLSITSNQDSIKALTDNLITLGKILATVFVITAIPKLFAGIASIALAFEKFYQSAGKTSIIISQMGGRAARTGSVFGKLALQIAGLSIAMGPLVAGTVALGLALAAAAKYSIDKIYNIDAMERLVARVREVREQVSLMNQEQASAAAQQATTRIQELTAEYEALKKVQQESMQLTMNAARLGIGLNTFDDSRLIALEEELDKQYDLRNVAKLRVAEIQEQTRAQEEATVVAQQLYEAEQERQRLADEAARGIQATIDTIAGLKEELMLLGLTERQQAIYNATKQAGANATLEELTQISALASELYDLTEIREQDAEATEAQVQAQQEMNQAIAQLTESYQEAISAAQEFVDTKQSEYEFQNLINTAVGAQRDYLEEMAEFDRDRINNLERLKVAAEEAAAAGVTGAMDQYNAAVQAYEAQRELFAEQAKQQAELQNSFAQGWREAIATIADSFTPYEMAQQSIQKGWGAISDAVDNFTKTGKFKFKDFALSAIADITSMVLKAQLLKGITGGLSLFGFKLPGLAAGGPAQANKPYIVGEQGPELFVPKSSGTVVPNGAGMGQTQAQVTNNYVTNNINAIDAKSVAQLFVENRKTLLGATVMARKEMPYGMA